MRRLVGMVVMVAVEVRVEEGQESILPSFKFNQTCESRNEISSISSRHVRTLLTWDVMADIKGVRPIVSLSPSNVAPSERSVRVSSLHEAGLGVEDGSIRLRTIEVESCFL